MGKFIHVVLFIAIFVSPIYAQDYAVNRTCKDQEVKSHDDLLKDNPNDMKGKCYYFFPAKLVKNITPQKQLHIFKTGAVLIDFGTTKAVSFMGNVIVTGKYDYVNETRKKVLIPVVMPTDDILISDSKFLDEHNSDEAIKAAEDFETLLFLGSDRSNLFSFCDISTKDGHLVVWIKERMLTIDKNKQNDAFKSILTLWRDTKYVREKGYGNWIEIKFHDINSGEITTIKTVK